MHKRILYILSPGSNVSAFDITMGIDAGYDLVLPFTGITADNVTQVIQDSLFCRPPARFNETGIFIAGQDINIATEMIDNAKKAMVDLFEVNVFADPNGAYTAAASIVALIDKTLRDNGSQLQGRHVVVFGVGPVALSAAVLAAKEGANPYLCPMIAEDKISPSNRFFKRYDVEIPWISAKTYRERIAAVEKAEVIITATKAGVRVLDEGILDHASRLLIAADTNAVPPSGIEGVSGTDNNALIKTNAGSFAGIGSMVIGDLKYKVQFGMFQKMLNSEEAVILDFEDAYGFALEYLHGESHEAHYAIRKTG